MPFDKWSDDAKSVLDFLYRFWAAQRRPSDVSDLFRATGFGFRKIRRTYRELQEGFAIVADDARLNLNLRSSRAMRCIIRYNSWYRTGKVSR